MSALNRGRATGRLVRDPHIGINQDGPKTVLLTLLCDRARPNPTTGERGTDAIQLVAWIRSVTVDAGPWSHVGRGDLTSVEYAVRNNSWADKTTGEIRYSMQPSVQSMEFLKSRSITQARKIAHLEAQQPGPLRKTSNRRAKAMLAATA